MGSIDSGQAYSALLNAMSECGDVGLVETNDHDCVAALIDGLGHGSEARAAALSAKNHIVKNINMPVDIIISGMHEQLKGTRGAVAAVCKINIVTGDASFSGIGNISVRLIGEDSIAFVSKDGVIGYSISSPTEKKFKLMPGDLLIFYSDGIKGHFGSEHKLAWSKLSSQVISEMILNSYKTNCDDASCVVVKYFDKK